MNSFIIGDFSNYGETFVSSPSYNVKIRNDLFNLVPKNHKIKKLLEIGCANGNNLFYLKKKYNLNKENVTGVDNCKLSSDLKINEFQFFHQSVESFLKDHKEKYDLIILSDVIEHLYNPWHTLKEIKNNLKKNSIVLLSIPNFQNIKYIDAIASGKFFYQKTGLFDETHIRFFTKDTIESYLSNLDFKINSTGWREDETIKNIKERLLKELLNKEFVYLELKNIRLKIFKENIKNYLSQQILVCFSNE